MFTWQPKITKPFLKIIKSVLHFLMNKFDHTSLFPVEWRNATQRCGPTLFAAVNTVFQRYLSRLTVSNTLKFLGFFFVQFLPVICDSRFSVSESFGSRLQMQSVMGSLLFLSELCQQTLYVDSLSLFDYRFSAKTEFI